MTISLSISQQVTLRDALDRSLDYSEPLTVSVESDGTLSLSGCCLAEVRVGGITQELREAVNKGLSKLDEFFGDRAAVRQVLGDLSDVNLDSTTDCILGRAFGRLAEHASEGDNWVYLSGYDLGMRALFGSDWASYGRDGGTVTSSDYAFARGNGGTNDQYVAAWSEALGA